MKKTANLTIACFSIAAFSTIAADKFNFDKLDLSKLPPAAEKKELTYAKDIKPILQASCLRCHGQQRPKGDLRLDNLEGVLLGGKDGKVVVAGDSKHSALIIAAAQIDDKTAMPPKRGPGGPGGPGGGNGPRPPGGSGGGDNGGGPRPPGQGGPGGPGGFPPAKPLTAEQVGIIRAWIDQGAK
jgi:Planctomycete cytochrome C